MHNVYDDPRYDDVVQRLKQQLLEKEKEIGDTDEKYPKLMEVRKQYWDQ